MWTADGDNWVFNQEFVWTELNYYNYHLAVTASDNMAYAFTGPVAGTTPAVVHDADGLEPNLLLGTYTVTDPAPAGYYWLNPSIEVTAGMFAAAKGKTNAFASRNGGSRAVFEYNGAIVFNLAPIPTTTYTAVANGPAGYTVNGNAFPYMVVDDNDTVNDLIGMIFTPDPVAGYHWEPASITVMEGDFVQNTAAYAFELVMDPIPDTWSLNVNGPDGYMIYKDTMSTGWVTDSTFGPTETQADLFGVYSLETPPAGFYWEPATITVDAATWGTKANYPATIEFTLMQIPTQFTYEVNAFDLAWYNGMGYEFPILYPPFLDPNDVNAQILFNGLPFDPPIYTPYLFGAPGNEPFLAGTYSVLLDPPYNAWQPESVTFDEIITNYATDFLGYQDEDTPVELSSFTATLTGQFYVQLTWVSQTETQMMGYLVYRNTTPDQSTSTLIDHPMIPATNTSTTQTYTVVDNDVNIGGTYYYWLEAIDYNNSSYHGPVSVTVEGNVPPVLPETTSMRSAYPNPFKAGSSTAIEVSLKAGEAGTVTIYNVLGQVVRSFSVNEGSHTINWNGKDSRGNACGSGVYFYKLSTPSLNQTKKMVIVK